MRAVLEKHQHLGRLSSSASDFSLSLLSDPGTFKAAGGGRLSTHVRRTSTLHGSLVTGKPGCEPQIQAVSPQCTTRSCLRSGPFPRTSAEIWDNESPRLAAGSLSACAAAAASSRLCRVTPAPGASEDSSAQVLDTSVAAGESAADQRCAKQNATVSKGAAKQRAKLPDPDLSGAANIVPSSSPAQGPVQGTGRAKQRQKQQDAPVSASDNEDGPSVPSTGLLPPS